MKKIRGMLTINEIEHATNGDLASLNNALAGLDEYSELKEAVKAEIVKRRYKLRKEK